MFKICLFSEFAVPVSRQDNFSTLINWVKESGGVTEAVSIDVFENVDFGLKANGAIPEGDLICAVPRKLMITLENVEQSLLKNIIANDPMVQHMGNVALALFVILEKAKGTDSYWYPYISTLPKDYNTVLYFAYDDLQKLKGSPILGKDTKFF